MKRTLLAVLLFALPVFPGIAIAGSVIVTNCSDQLEGYKEYYVSFEFKTYNKRDKLRWVAASVSKPLGTGHSEELTCRTDSCQVWTEVHLNLAAVDQPKESDQGPMLEMMGDLHNTEMKPLKLQLGDGPDGEEPWPSGTKLCYGARYDSDGSLDGHFYWEVD